mmetsp:Transcript_8495/g.21202  ORF Transcript_8495/g.21202 Transcript_8495/m.21202 type:complete len:267 (-) Transcript_8495:543-1343(-)
MALSGLHSHPGPWIRSKGGGDVGGRFQSIRSNICKRAGTMPRSMSRSCTSALRFPARSVHKTKSTSTWWVKRARALRLSCGSAAAYVGAAGASCQSSASSTPRRASMPWCCAGGRLAMISSAQRERGVRCTSTSFTMRGRNSGIASSTAWLRSVGFTCGDSACSRRAARRSAAWEILRSWGVRSSDSKTRRARTLQKKAIWRLERLLISPSTSGTHDRLNTSPRSARISSVSPTASSKAALCRISEKRKITKGRWEERSSESAGRE